MAQTTTPPSDPLEEAMVTFEQNYAALLANPAVFIEHQKRERERQLAERRQIDSERLARIEALLAEITRLLQALPEAISERIRSQFPGQQKPSE